MEGERKEIIYFEHCGEVNTERTLELVRERSEELGIKKVVIASETGRSALSRSLNGMREISLL